MFMRAKLGTGLVLVSNELASLTLCNTYIFDHVNDCEQLYLLENEKFLAATCTIRLPNI